METCPNCGQDIRSTARFCTSCGFRIPERPADATAQGRTSTYASTWLAESTSSEPAPAVSVSEPNAVVAESPASTWPVNGESAPAPDYSWAAPVVAPDPVEEIVAATAGFSEESDTIADISENKVNIALYHIESIRQLIPDLSAWSEDRAAAVNKAIAAMETAIKGREEDDDTFHGLRQTVAAAKKDPRDIDVMIALSDRAIDIEDLLAAHDKYSIGIRRALIGLKPIAVEYVKVPKRRVPATRSSSSRSSRARSTAGAKSANRTKSNSTNKADAAEKSS